MDIKHEMIDPDKIAETGLSVYISNYEVANSSDMVQDSDNPKKLFLRMSCSH